MYRLVFVVMASALLMTACRGRQAAAPAEADVEPTDTPATAMTYADSLEQLITETPMPRAADELFDDFLFNFAANRKLQMERVAYPLTVVRNGDTTLIEKGQWQMDHFFMRQDYYTVLFDDEQQMEVVKDTAVSQATVEKIYFNTKAVIQYYFSRIKGAWMLIGQKTEPMAANRNGDFLEFYHRFVTDTLFQTQSLNETVTFVGPDPDDDFAQMEGILTPDTWPAFAPELPDRMMYNIVYGKPAADTGRKVFVMRGIANGLEVEMTFAKKDGKWRLMKMVN